MGWCGQRRGIALVLVLVAMLLVSVVATGAFCQALQHFRAGVGEVAQLRALLAAESGLEHTLAGWDPSWSVDPIGQPVLREALRVGLAADTVRSIRLAPAQWLVAVGGYSGVGSSHARYRIAALVALDSLGRPVLAKRGLTPLW